MKKHQRCEYQWTDCQSIDLWTHSDAVDETVGEKARRIFKNVGYFVCKKNNFMVFAAGYTPETDTTKFQYFHLTIIPKGMVLKIKNL